MKLRPLGDRLIVKPVAKEEVTKSGLILPDTAKEERPEQGEVIEVGPGKLLENGTRQALAVKDCGHGMSSLNHPAFAEPGYLCCAHT